MKYIPLIVCLLALSLFFHPLARSDVVIAGHDAGYHFTRLALFANALKDGQFPVRWIEGPAEGLSHPLFQFYPPFFYYLSSIFHLMRISIVSSAYAGLMLAGLLGWAGMFWLSKKLLVKLDETGIQNSFSLPVSTLASLGSATLFLFTPYRISQLYVRAAYGEFLATSMLPFLFVGMIGLFEAGRGAKRDTAWAHGVLLAVAFFGILLSHQPTMLMSIPFVLAWGVYLWLMTKNTWGIVYCAVFFGAGVLFSSTFLLPMYVEQQYISSSALTANYFDFRQHFAAVSQLFSSAWGYGVSQKGPNDGMSFQVGILNWLAVLFPLGLFWYEQMSKKRTAGGGFGWDIGFFAGMFVASLFLSTNISLPIWERIGAFSFIQYPWRFLSQASLASSVLAGIGIALLFRREFEKKSGYAVFLGVVMVLFNIKYIAPAAYLPRRTFDLSNPELVRYNSPDNPFFGIEMGYMPVFTRELSLHSGGKKAVVVLGNAAITPVTVGITRQSFEVEAKEVSTIRILTHYFPGWVVFLDGKETVPAYNNPEGFMEVTVGSGKHTVSAVLHKTPIRLFSDYLSLGTALALAGISIFSLRRFWSK